MNDPTDPVRRPFRLVLDGGEVVESGGTVRPRHAKAAVPELVLRMPASRAHWLAHVLDTRQQSIADREPSDRVLARSLEAAAAALGDLGAMSCMARELGGVDAKQRLAATAILGEREPRLSGVQRMAVVDAAARWFGEEAGDELAFALLGAVCRSDVTTAQVYTALLVPPVEPERGDGS
ncbi:MAG TPA: hypothetical protein VMU51_03985 [Mycobacteriales bacterium]|nr:hypothetical protein [Mycobacteriales bacterium]